MTKPKKKQLEDDAPKRLDEDDPPDDLVDPVTGLRKPSPEQTADENNTGGLGDPRDVDF